MNGHDSNCDCLQNRRFHPKPPAPTSSWTSSESQGSTSGNSNIASTNSQSHHPNGPRNAWLPPQQPSSTDSNAPATCVICFEDNVNIRTECCKKSYHMMCILKWVITSPTCPSCRELFIDDPSYRTTLLASAPGPFEHARAQMYNLQLNLQAVMQAEGHGQYGQTPSYEGSEDGDGDDDEDAWVDEDEDEEEEFDYDEDDEDGLDSNGSYEDSDSSSQEESVESDEDLEFNEPQETVELSVYDGHRQQPQWFKTKTCPDRSCARVFCHARALQDHLRNTSQHIVWTCCGKVFVNGLALRNHCRSCH